MFEIIGISHQTRYLIGTHCLLISTLVLKSVGEWALILIQRSIMALTVTKQRKVRRLCDLLDTLDFVREMNDCNLRRSHLGLFKP